jgi:hypothetical protein
MKYIAICIFLLSCSKQELHPKWEHDIRNPENGEFVVEVAFNLGKDVKDVTQEEFNSRYEIKKTLEYYEY